MKLTKKAFREYLNKECKGMPLHKHNQFHQLKREYGDYLYYQDRVKFNANYEEWLDEQKGKSRRFVIGDIHGRFEALKDVLKKVEFDYKKDKLIVLGDVVDGGYNTYEVVEELLKIKNLIYIIGNHDEWFMNHIKTGWAEEIWLQQGGGATLKSYGASVITARKFFESSRVDTTNIKIPVTHQDFFNRGKYYYVEDNMLFVHGGFIPIFPIEKTKREDLLWDRDLIKYAQAGNFVKPYDWVFVGHTTTQTYGLTQPIRYSNLFMMDCGAGWKGKLCIMDIDTKKYKLSKELLPSVRTT